jgi:polyhydroxyalkanoate synthase
MTGAEVRFVLSGSGHIAGVVNPPALGKYQFWTNPDMTAPSLEAWLDGAEETAGSWWPDWDAWLKTLSGRQVAARAPGARLGVIEPAPGAYVKVRFDRPESQGDGARPAVDDTTRAEPRVSLSLSRDST